METIEPYPYVLLLFFLFLLQVGRKLYLSFIREIAKSVERKQGKNMEL